MSGIWPKLNKKFSPIRCGKADARVMVVFFSTGPRNTRRSILAVQDAIFKYFVYIQAVTAYFSMSLKSKDHLSIERFFLSIDMGVTADKFHAKWYGKLSSVQGLIVLVY